MIYILLAATIIFNSVQNFITKQYNIKVKNSNTYVYTAFVALFAMIFFAVASGGRFVFNTHVLRYSAVFAVFYSMATVGTVLAIRTGPLAITALLNQCSLIIPTLFGLAVLNEEIGHTGYIGIAALFVAIFLSNPNCSGGSSDEKKVSSRWFLWMLAGFVGNGMCSTVQKLQQLEFNGGYRNEFMIYALFVVFVFMFTAAFLSKADIKRAAVGAARHAPVNGIANGACNMLAMILAGLLPAAVLYPSVSAGGMVVTFVVAVFVYKEKLPPRQLIGYIMGIVSIILINI